MAIANSGAWVAQLSLMAQAAIPSAVKGVGLPFAIGNEDMELKL